ncbi:MAG: bifunctional folylpolyglutamate synthase/dihydrofolate synthase [Thermoflexales bacterium]|nr:bifunctional folylpolyglutamate synthase/dihydrofolate synthase [Thermoflexales bacterium]
MLTLKMKALSYQAALAYLDHYINYERERPAALAPGTFDLARMEALLADLGDPHCRYGVVHVAGTKGKGSVCAMIESVLRLAGFRTGLYTSPHLHTFRERVRVGGQAIAPDEMAALVDEMAPHAEAIPGLTWFEFVTALALLYFARREVEVAIVEVGLGGRLDATNVVSPLLSVITSLSLDHTAWLGETLAQIAAEKAGIIKPGRPVVSAPQSLEALRVIESRCAQLESALTLVGREWRFEPGAISTEGQSFYVTPPGQSRRLGLPSEHASFFIGLLGQHQVLNAVVALASLAHLGSMGLHVSPRHIREGLAGVWWPGRLEVLSREPLVVCDGAHNGDSARCLAAALREHFPGRRWTLIFGASSDKDLGAMLDVLAPFAGRVLATRTRHSRAAEPELLASLVRERGADVEVATSVPDALALALAQPGEQAGVIATGSLFVAAEARETWAQRSGRPLPETDDMGADLPRPKGGIC